MIQTFTSIRDQRGGLRWESIQGWCASKYYINSDPSLEESFDVDIDKPVLHCFVDAAHTNNLQKRCSTTGLVFTFCKGSIVYKIKPQSITTGSSTEVEFIATHTAAKIDICLCMILK